MAGMKTKPDKSKSVTEIINQVEKEQKRKDAFEVLEMMKNVTNLEPVMWGDSIIGFGDYHYKYASGREGDWFQIGFSPRKQNIALYIMSGFKQYSELLKNLGKYKKGVSCLYINKLDDIDRDVLQSLMEQSVNYIRKAYKAD
ncbi:DUF1801 domain-containing protein [Salibacter sp.]|uniref:DUF1801 domain-containing protein n=1 Tax=Salibacter sp. TaxID=2010995 RepID=UPI0028706034|nr:DUF1801 domain-containing protein [Salibacter sp.]MDR9398985.1 DUF1801 domain-containing protein [Salibacter sp.]MDR9487070.1 DUF1801 domain-containing protein [Salibacter sp.]